MKPMTNNEKAKALSELIQKLFPQKPFVLAIDVGEGMFNLSNLKDEALPKFLKLVLETSELPPDSITHYNYNKD